MAQGRLLGSDNLLAGLDVRVQALVHDEALLLLQIKHEEVALSAEDVSAVELTRGHVRDVVDGLEDAAFDALVDGELPAVGVRASDQHRPRTRGGKRDKKQNLERIHFLVKKLMFDIPLDLNNWTVNFVVFANLFIV